jgi:DNA-binding NarL/FixJ family response regulator
MDANTITVVLADDHPLVRAGMRTTLSAQSDIALVGEAADGFEAQHLCRELQPDVLLLDLNMPGPRPVDTVAALRQLCPSVKVLILTAYDDDAYIRGLVGAGVAGYVLKDEAPETVVVAIRAVMQGGTWFSRPVIAKLANRVTGTEATPHIPALTDRERQLLQMIAQGWDNVRIATELNLAEQTVRNYISRLYEKMGVRSRGEAIVWARENG